MNQKHIQDVHVAPVSPSRFQELLTEQAWTVFHDAIERSGTLLKERVVWNVNSTAAGGGVAEMLRSLLAYSRGTGADVRWVVISGSPDFFRVTKRLHNLLHGDPGDGGELGDTERPIYESAIRQNAEELASIIRPQDAVILHDPQTAGLVQPLKDTGALVVWRSHVGAEQQNERVEQAWEFLLPYVTPADAYVFSRYGYVPPELKREGAEIIAPSIDPFSAKNQGMKAEVVRAILSHVGLVVGQMPSGAVPTFLHHDGSPGRVDHRCDVLRTGPPPDFDTPLVVQVSRWDRLKDPVGVMRGFAQQVVKGSTAHLILAGPSVHSVADDPEGAQTLDEAESFWRSLPHATRSRIHLACLPMQDIEENAAIVNALQRHATVMVQKSLQEGFGLTVTEAMWKVRPVVATCVGGIREQIEDGIHGLLLKDPTDPVEFGHAVLRFLRDSELAAQVAQRARERVREEFLRSRHLVQYVKLLEKLIG